RLSKNESAAFIHAGKGSCRKTICSGRILIHRCHFSLGNFPGFSVCRPNIYGQVVGQAGKDLCLDRRERNYLVLNETRRSEADLYSGFRVLSTGQRKSIFFGNALSVRGDGEAIVSSHNNKIGVRCRSESPNEPSVALRVS